MFLAHLPDKQTAAHALAVVLNAGHLMSRYLGTRDSDLIHMKQLEAAPAKKIDLLTKPTASSLHHMTRSQSELGLHLTLYQSSQGASLTEMRLSSSQAAMRALR